MSTATFVPSSLDTANSNYPGTYYSTNVLENAFTNANSSTRWAPYTNTGSGATTTIYLNFDCSEIPSAATIDSVTCSVKCGTQGTNYFNTRTVQMASGTTTKGSATTMSGSNSSPQTHSLSVGTWTAAEIRNAKLKFVVTRGSNNTSTDATFSIYGATLTVNYTINLPTFTVDASSEVTSVTISPASQTVYQGESAEVVIDTTDISNYILKDNNTDVTSSAVYHHDTGGSQTEDNVLGTYTLVSGGFNGSGASYFSGLVGKGHTSSTTSSNYYSSGSGTIAIFTYDVSFHNIPSNATITNCYAMVSGHAESTSNSNEYMCAQIRSGSTQLSSELNFKSVGTSNSTQTITCTTIPTIEQLANLQLYCRLGYYGGALNGATVYVEYSTPSGYYYTYTIASVTTNHTILLSESSSPYIPDPEDPTKTYYSLTISSINATTTISGETVTGTTRIEEGTSETITITPSDPLLALALDNGVDITNQLVSHMPSNTYTVTTQKSGASYGFPLNSTTGYYTSNNNAKSNSAAVCTVNFNFETSCLVTISYINYAEATYDYGIFSQIDGSLGTTYTADSGAYHTCSASSDNTSAVQTLTYTIPAGTHTIDIKYRKDQATDSNNDNLQWKITSIEPTTGAGYYEYTLDDIDKKHSLIFVFGNVTYYFITSTYAGEGRIFPDGQQVVLPGDNYRINIVPDNYQATVTMTDNGTNVTSQLESATGQDKQGNTVTSYKYTLSNIQTAHNLVVSIGGASSKIYLKINGTWTQYSKVYMKIDGAWIEQVDLNTVFNANGNYVKE